MSHHDHGIRRVVVVALDAEAGAWVNARSAAPVPLETEACELPEVRAVYDAFDADPGPGKTAPHNLAMLLGACADAGVAVGAYDSRILHWLAGWEPATVAVVAGLITRAARDLGVDPGDMA